MISRRKTYVPLNKELTLAKTLGLFIKGQATGVCSDLPSGACPYIQGVPFLNSYL